MNFVVTPKMIRLGFSSAALIAVALALAVTLLIPRDALARHRHAPARAQAGRTQPPPLTEPYVAACTMEPTTGTIIFEKDIHRQWPMASVTKMMLMLIVAQKLDDGSLKLTDMVTTSAKASKIGGSQVYLKEGERFSIDDMMKAIVVHSANDSSVAVAEHVAGSTDAFVEMMNHQAVALGLKDTHYYSVDGLPPAPGQQADVSSAYDLCRLSRALMKYPQILTWSSIDTAPFRNGLFELRNTNHLVRTYPGCDGLKTGFYDKAGFNVVATAHRSGLRLIAVVLGSPNKNENFNSAATLLSQGFLNYQMQTVAKAGTPVEQAVAVKDGAVNSVKPVWARDVSVFVKRDEAKRAFKLDYKLPVSVAAPVTAGQTIGMGVLSMGSNAPQEVPLVAAQDVPRGTLVQRLMGRL
jgi:serine-type D-Ala-D-Ala carboxypeptidase (penicillin-binding protein 5/6)